VALVLASIERGLAKANGTPNESDGVTTYDRVALIWAVLFCNCVYFSLLFRDNPVLGSTSSLMFTWHPDSTLWYKVVKKCTKVC
jgi:hypothetical protein